MGLDVYLSKVADFGAMCVTKALEDEQTEAVWAEYPVPSDEERKEALDRCERIRRELGYVEGRFGLQYPEERISIV